MRASELVLYPALIPFDNPVDRLIQRILRLSDYEQSRRLWRRGIHQSRAATNPNEDKPAAKPSRWTWKIGVHGIWTSTSPITSLPSISSLRHPRAVVPTSSKKRTRTGACQLSETQTKRALPVRFRQEIQEIPGIAFRGVGKWFPGGAQRKLRRLIEATYAICRDVISYWNVAGSRQSSRPSAVSACGYIRKPNCAPRDPGRFTSCAKL